MIPTPEYLRSLSQSDRVRILNYLHEAVKHRCPVNKVGTPLVSDFDKLAADDAEWSEVMRKMNPKNP